MNDSLNKIMIKVFGKQLKIEFKRSERQSITVTKINKCIVFIFKFKNPRWPPCIFLKV